MLYEPPQTPHNVAGSCVALRQCGPVLQLLQAGLSRDKVSYVRRSVCRIKGKLTCKPCLTMLYSTYLTLKISPS